MPNFFKNQSILKTFLFHFRPRTVPEPTLKFSLTWGLGGMAAVLVGLQLATGLLLKFVYEPDPVRAYASILVLQNEVLFGGLIRNIHHWSAHFLVATIFLHFLRTFFTGAFQPPRQWNWLIGLGMFALVLSANFTGYLLPWDQLAFWAITITTRMLEYIPVLGDWLLELVTRDGELSAETLRLFYALHTGIIPVIVVALMAFHFWRVRKVGGLVIPRDPGTNPPEQVTRVPTVPNLLLREAVVALVLMAVVLSVSVVWYAPLEDPANPGLSPNPTKPPWYFGGIQEMLLHFHPVFAVAVIPALTLLGLMVLPYVAAEKNTSGIWFVSYIGRKTAGLSAGVAVTATLLLIFLDEFIVQSQRYSIAGAGGLVSLGLFLLDLILLLLVIKKFFKTSKRETVQAAVVFFVTVYVALTIVDVWFRGTGMTLAWP